MLKPPHQFPGHARGNHGHGPRLKGRTKDVLLQCSACGAIASGRIDGRFFLGINLPHRLRSGQPWHTGCGGQLVAYDIAAPEVR